MTSNTWTRLSLVALLAALAGSMGPTECAPAGDASATSPPAALELVPQSPQSGDGSSWYAVVLVQARASAPAQAFDVDLSFPPGVATRAMAAPHASFDDDLGLASAGAPDLPNGRLLHVVDVRHGAAGALAGNLNLAYVLIRVSGGTPIWVEASGTLAGPDGQLFATTPAERVLVSPPRTR